MFMNVSDECGACVSSGTVKFPPLDVDGLPLYKVLRMVKINLALCLANEARRMKVHGKVHV